MSPLHRLATLVYPLIVLVAAVAWSPADEVTTELIDGNRKTVTTSRSETQDIGQESTTTHSTIVSVYERSINLMGFMQGLAGPVAAANAWEPVSITTDIAITNATRHANRWANTTRNETQHIEEVMGPNGSYENRRRVATSRQADNSDPAGAADKPGMVYTEDSTWTGSERREGRTVRALTMTAAYKFQRDVGRWADQEPGAIVPLGCSVAWTLTTDEGDGQPLSESYSRNATWSWLGDLRSFAIQGTSDGASVIALAVDRTANTRTFLLDGVVQPNPGAADGTMCPIIDHLMRIETRSHPLKMWTTRSLPTDQILFLQAALALFAALA